jgi:hypothetical protein
MAINNKLDDIRDIILNYLFDDNQDKIDKWASNKKIKINDNFKPLLQGDWTRYKYPKQNKLNLDNLLNEKTTKTDIFNSIVKELKIPSSKENYAQNFNPNWFFIFYEEFLNEKIFKIIEVKDSNDRIIGLQIIEYEKYRLEIIKIIELHSRFILNINLQKILSEKFIEYFFQGCYIQYKIKDNNFKNYYLDLCYVIEENELCLEINEYHHNEIVDDIRKMNVMISSKCRLVNFNLNDCYETIDKVYENIIKSFCKIIYHNGLRIESIKLYLVEINKMELGIINIGVNIKEAKQKLKLSELLSLPFFDPSIKLNIDDIIESVIKKCNINPKYDFSIIYKKEITKENLIQDKKKLELTSFGIKNWLLSIDGKIWTKRNDYINFMDDLEREYYNVIENIMKDDELGQIQQEYIKLKNIIGCKRYDSDLFFDKVKQKKLFTNKLHKNVPFIIKEDKEYINYDSLSIILSKDIIDKINVKEFVKDSFIPNYRLMFPSELDQIYLDDFID